MMDLVLMQLCSCSYPENIMLCTAVCDVQKCVLMDSAIKSILQMVESVGLFPAEKIAWIEVRGMDSFVS